MSKIVYPTILEKAKRKIDSRNLKFLKKNRIITNLLNPGALVMVKDETRSNKHEPIYEGPFVIVRRTAGGPYVLKGPDGTEYKRDASVLKSIHQEAAIQGITAEVEEIIGERVEPDDSKPFLVKWKGISPHLNSWVPHADFIDHGPISKWIKKNSSNVAKASHVIQVKPANPKRIKLNVNKR
jgi:hypothetical protein